MTMTLRQLATEIQKLKPGERDKLLKMLKAAQDARKWRGRPDDPFAKIIGIAHAGRNGALEYERDLYGGDQPL